MNESTRPDTAGGLASGTVAATPDDDGADDPVGRLAVALRARVEAQRRAEDRLASFAFTEGPARNLPASPAGAPGESVDWRYFASAALRAVSDPTTLSMLEEVRGDGRPIHELAGLPGSGIHDHLAVTDRIGRLASAGLVVRELESDRISLTGLGEALLDLVVEIERRAGAGER